jgi:hypothetical protein
MPRGQAPGRVRSDTDGAGASCGETAGPRRTVCRLGVLALRAAVILSPQL